MSDQQNDNDAARIRAKRMAKLAGANAQSPAAPEQSNGSASVPTVSTPDAAPSQSPAPQQVSSPKAAPSSESNPFAQLGLKSDQPTKEPVRTKINITPAKREGDGQTRPRSRQGRQETPEDWEDRILGSVFRATLKEDRTSDSQGPLNLLVGLRSDLEESEVPVRLTVSNLDSALIEVASNFSNGKPLDFLLGCWKRVIKLGRSLRNPATEPWKAEIAKEARRQCMSYTLFAVSTPEMFNVEANGVELLADRMVENPDGETGTCFDFFQEAATRVQDDEDARNALVGAMAELSKRLSKISMDGDYRSYMMALRNFIVHPPLCDALTKHESFIPDNVAPQDIETQSFLGPFFRLSPLQADVAKSYFAAAVSQPESVVRNTQNSSRMALKTHQDELFDIVNVIVKTGKEPREKLLDWFALTVNANHKRRAMQVDYKTVSSDALMVNITVILDRLFEPAMDATFSKIDRIDVDYLRRSPRVNIQDETKVNADQKTSDEFYSHKAEGTNNFITETFFLTIAAHHYGTEAAHSHLQNKERSIRHLEKEIGKMEADRHKFVHNPAQLAMFDNAVKKYKDQLTQSKCEIQATRGILLDETTQGRSMQLMRYVIVFLLRTASAQKLPKETLSLPLPSDQRDVFACLPEYFLLDVVDNFKFISRYMPWIITSTQCEELVDFCITFLRNSEYVKNPYTKSGLVTILFHGVYPVPNRAKGVLGDTLNASPFAYKHLLHALMKFYIEAESTGTHTQFYDKFNIRYEIFQVIRCIWSNTVYRDNLATEARVNVDFFVRFVNLLLNDVTFVLDESFTAFKKIHDLTEELRRLPSDTDASAKQEKEEALSDAKGKAKSYMQLTNETVSMLKLFTEALADSFTKQEIVQRLADMLDYNLDALTGPKQRELKVENPQEYGWRPQEMLSDIMDVYLNLRQKTNFHLAVARDGRSYRPANFATARRVMERFALQSPEQLRQWDVLAAAIAHAKAEDDKAEEDMGEIPDDFLDPILATLMEDPVILPKSKMTVDRSTIRSHLLSDPTDPFNRQPMTIEEVLPDEDMQARIDAWRQERAAKKDEKIAEAVAAAGSEPMDTT